MTNQENVKEARGSQPRRAVCYIRVARTHEGSTAAVERQREACERKARELGVTDTDIYVDTGAGSRIGRQPALRAMLDRLESDAHISCVITYDHARLSRNSEEYRQIIRALDAVGVRLVTVDGSGGPGYQKFMRTITEVMADLTVQHQRSARRAEEVSSW